MSSKFTKLLEPGIIGKMKVPNKIVKLPTRTGFANRDGSASERILRHYKEMAVGGAGLVIVGAAFVDNKASITAPAVLGASDASYMYGLSQLAQAIRDNGARAAIQIHHGGAQRMVGRPIKGMSRVPYEDHYSAGGTGIVPEELTVEEIAEIVEAFGDSARVCKNAGFDMVEIHAAHGYLLTQSLSPFMNRRQDLYGGSLKNRMRFLLEVIANIRKKTGDDYPLCVRLSATEHFPGGITIEETLEVVKACEKAGVDVISISSGCRQSEDSFVIPMYAPTSMNVGYAEAVKKVVGIPIIVGGAITTPAMGEEILKEGKADFIGYARPLIADPYLPRKIKEDRPEDVRPCIRDNEGCWNLQRRGWGGMRCTVNVSAGKEDEYRIRPTSNPKKVAVIGGGPGGLEAARVAALSGHQVTLFEKERMAGHLIEASIPDFKKDIERLIEWFKVQIQKLKVEVVHKEANAGDIQKGGFQAVIVATGGRPIVPEIPGANKPLVKGALDILNDHSKTGQRVVVVGGGLIGCDLALFLAEQGKRVTLIEMLDEIAKEMERKAERKSFLSRLGKTDMEVCVRTKVVEIMDSGVVVSDPAGKSRRIEADNVILAVGLAPAPWPDLEKITREGKIEAYEVGDCIKPRKIFDAILEGHLAARRLDQ